MKVVLADLKLAIRDAVAAELDALVTLSVTDLGSPTRSAQLAEADIWVVGLGPPEGYQADVIQSATALKGILMCGLGFDHIDIRAAARRGIPVANAPEFSVSIAEAALTLILMTTKHFPALKQAVDQGTWPAPSEDRGLTLAGKTLGIVGLGHIGGQTAHYGRAIGMTVLAADPQLTPEQAAERGADSLVDLDVLLERSDIVLLSCPLSKSTFHLIDGAALARMKPTAYLINIGRGGLVDEPALIDALSKGNLAGAGLDVLEHEPPAPDNPLLSMRNVVITPHSLGATVENTTIIATSVRRSVESLLRGEKPQNTVNL
jgi:D-3-phosphoglycerate dehydrogenase